MEMTRHAAIRSHQRNVSKLVITWIREFGNQIYDHHGGVIRCLDKKGAREKLEKAIGFQIVRMMEQYLNCYVVEHNETGMVIAAGHHYGRFHS